MIPLLPYYNNPDILREIDIRGRFLMMGADLEYSLMNIIAFSAPNPLDQRSFHKMTLNEKIDCAKCDLRRYKLDYYRMYEPKFKLLNEFRLVRNYMAHGKMDFVGNNLNIARVAFIDVDDDKNEGLKYIDFTAEYMNDCLSRFKEINMDFARLWLDLKIDFDKTHPPPLLQAPPPDPL